MKVKEESEKADFETQYSKTKILHLVEKVEIVTDFIFLGSKITADGDCSEFNVSLYEIKRCLLLGRKDMMKLDRY